MNKIATVLGASGNIGLLLVARLGKLGYEVRAVGRTKPHFSLPGVTNIAVDYDDIEQLTQVMQGSDHSYMLIGLKYDTALWQSTWTGLTTRLIQAAIASHTKFVFFDNVYGYGLVTGEMTEQTPLNPTSKKGAVRAQMNTLLVEAMQNQGLQAVVARCADFYGPGITSSVIGERFFSQILKAQTFEWLGNSHVLHSFSYVDDAVEAIIVLAESPNSTGKTYHLPVANPNMTGDQLKNLIEKITNQPLKLSLLTRNMTYLLQFFAPLLSQVREMMYQNEHSYVVSSEKNRT